MSAFSLEGRRALVTGASRGLGRAIALALAEAGADVLVCSRQAEPLERLVAQIISTGGQARALALDLADRGASDATLARISRDLGGPDILVNCAGDIVRGRFLDGRDEDWDRILELNLTAPYRLCRAIAPGMLRKGWGRILNVGSILSFVGKATVPAYVASKHGIAGLTRALAAELGPGGVCVNALCPGYIRTDLNQSLQSDPTFNSRLESSTALRRWGEPTEIGPAAVFLCSPAASYLTGHLLVVDGGMTAIH